MTTPRTPPVFEGRDPVLASGDLVWWLPRKGVAPEGWFELTGHACDGFKLDYLDGWVRPLQPSAPALKTIDAIANEVFAAECEPGNLDWGVTDQHRQAYVRYLAERGLEAGDTRKLMQAVYPLAATKSCLQALGVDDPTVPSGASLLVLGSNCD